MFKPTEAQRKALALLKSGAKHILLFGGSRSGKTTVLVMAVIYRAVRYAGSRHLICRLRAKDARSSVLRETLLPLLSNTIGNSNYSHNVHGDLITLFNGSEIWIGGLGDREQADKILGHEYNTIYFNEVSQLSYAAITTAQAAQRLAAVRCAGGTPDTRYENAGALRGWNPRRGGSPQRSAGVGGDFPLPISQTYLTPCLKSRNSVLRRGCG